MHTIKDMTNSNTYVIEDGQTQLGETLGLKSVEFTQNLLTDDAIDEWLATTVFGINSNIQKLIIPIRLGNDDADYIGLRVGLHVRLSRSLGNKRFIPLVFASVGEYKELIIGNQIERKSLLSAFLLFTKGCTLVDIFDLEHAVADFDEVIDEDILRNDLLKKLVITDGRLQGHQLANEWGALRLAKFAGIELTTIKQPRDLYFKYQFSLSDLEIDSKGKNKTNIHSNKDCSYLLIDDNALNGWEELLTHIIQSEIINKFTRKTISKSLITFEKAYTYENYESHDLIFLDLRLTKEEDDSKNSIPINEYSGVKLLDKIKEINEGIQVIILTASNKAWNMKALLDAGADGYFIKESPDIPVSDNVSKANYENLVASIKEAFERRYLLNVYKDIKVLHQKLDNLIASNSYSAYFLNELKSQLSIAFGMHYKAKSKEQFAFAFITLYMIIERVNKEFVTSTGENDSKEWFVELSGGLINWKWDNGNYEVDNIVQYVSGNKPPEWKKIVGICKQKFPGTIEESKLKSIYELISMRNHFIHKDDRLLEPRYKDRNKNIPKIYTNKGFQELFEIIKEIISLLK
jgi:DNA-binding NarL/FixJ family response regulator